MNILTQMVRSDDAKPEELLRTGFSVVKRII